MRRRFVLLVVGLISLGLLGLLVSIRVTTPPHRINRTSFDATAVGWTGGDVEAIQRASAGVYAAPSTTIRVAPENEHLAGEFSVDNLVAPPERHRCRARGRGRRRDSDS